MQPNKMSSLAESVKELWDTRSIQGLIILSFSLQCFLILFAPLRKQTGGKWVWFIMIPLWIAYLIADFVAVFTIGLILRAQRSGMLALWSAFLFLHLGGPDTITSFSIEDNEFWIRHLLGLLARVGSSVYIILLSLSNDMLWLPTLLVLIAGIIKYAERNRALFLASFDHMGNNWKEGNEYMPPVPKQFSKLIKDWKPNESTPNPHEQTSSPGAIVRAAVPEVLKILYSRAYRGVLNLLQPGLQGNNQKRKSSSEETTEDQKLVSVEAAVYLVGITKNLLVGPPLSSFEKSLLPKDAHGMLRAIEIHLSLLYELLHTKLPVVDSDVGYVCRIVNLGCILGALVSFPILLNKRNRIKFEEFNIWLTFGLLIGALALELISIMLLIFSSDWITMAHFQKKWNSHKFINNRRWSNSIPQLNIFGNFDLLEKEAGLAKEDSFDFLGLRSLFRKIRRTRWVKFKRFKEHQEWQFIVKTLQEKKKEAPPRPIFNDMSLLIKTYIHTVTKNVFGKYKFVTSSLEECDHMDSLLIWHIVTECLYQEKNSAPSPSSPSPSNDSDPRTVPQGKNIDHRRICKLLSDYMFYLLVMEPTMITVSPNSWKIVFEDEGNQKTSDWLMKLKKGCKENPSGKDINSAHNKSKEKRISRVKRIAHNLLVNLKSKDPWNLMANVWVELVSYAAVSCQPTVHARQVSKGGQLLTLVWMLMNYMELTPSGWFNSVQETDHA